MITGRFALIAIACAVVLCGCGLVSPSDTPASPSPTVPAGPVELTTEEAAERYLHIVCPSNVADDALVAAFQSDEPAYLEGEAPDPRAVNEAAEEAIETDRVTVALFDDELYIWPDEVADLIPILQDDYIAARATLEQIASAPDFETAYLATYPDFTAAQAASQELRAHLDLGTDTKATCIGYADGHERLQGD